MKRGGQAQIQNYKPKFLIVALKCKGARTRKEHSHMLNRDYLSLIRGGL